MKGVYWALRSYVAACGLLAVGIALTGHLPPPLEQGLPRILGCLGVALLLLLPNRITLKAPWLQIRLLLLAALFCGLVWLSSRLPWGRAPWAPLAGLGLMTLGVAAPLTLWMRVTEPDESPFRSHDEFFRAMQDLLARLEAGGHAESAAELKEGLACLNGLTDGWALLLESVEKVRARAGILAPPERKALEEIRKGVRSLVYRR